METTGGDIRKSGVLKTWMLAACAAVTLGSAYVAYDQYMKNHLLEKELGENSIEAERLVETFAMIENNLASIRKHEGTLLENLTLEDFEAPVSPEDRIMNEIRIIEHLMNENRAMIADLESKMGEKDSRLAGSEKSVIELEKRIKEYKTRTSLLAAETEALKKDLGTVREQNAAMAEDIALKDRDIGEKENLIRNQSDLLHSNAIELEQKEQKIQTAYYTVGTVKELRKNKVLEKKGGIFGLASAKAMKDDFNRDQFRKIDILTNTSIPVFSGDVEIVSNHDSNTYEMMRDEDGKVQWIRITNPERFWENSRYLVVVVRENWFAQVFLGKDE